MTRMNIKSIDNAIVIIICIAIPFAICNNISYSYSYFFYLFPGECCLQHRGGYNEHSHTKLSVHIGP